MNSTGYKPKLIAHRGYAARYPENTIIAIEAAIEAGAAFVEVDVQLAADGTPVLFHDRTLNRMCGVDGVIADYTPQQLVCFSASEPDRFGDAFSGTPIATVAELAALMRRHPKVHFFIELKCESIEHFDSTMVLECTRQALKEMEGMYTLISFSVETIGMAMTPGISTGLVLENWQQRQGLGKKGSGLLFSTNQETKQTALNNRPDPFFLFCNIRHLPASGRLHIPGAKLAIYEVADPELAQELVARGVDFVETFAIGEMQEALLKH